MKKFFALMVLVVLGLTQEVIANEVYYAKIGYNDKINSYGERLGSVADILRQDRANYHKFFVRDREDSGDRFFAYPDNRERMASMLRNGYISPATRDAIMYGNPVVRVTIYDYRIEVELY
ncbi:MAG: hypothetical protein KU38_10875 [Sulfurovum sp. FS08-3]|nr:MAG: hypothetical protein KU38_10875 [Sulfurovum sp. FS08-3]